MLRRLLSAKGEGDSAWIDTESVLAWFVTATSGVGPQGFVVTCGGRPPPPGTVVRAHSNSQHVEAPDVEVPAVVDRSELALSLIATDPGRSRCYLVLPTGLYLLRRSGSEPFEISDSAMAQIVFAADVLGSCRVHWFWKRESSAAWPERTSWYDCIVR